MSFSVHPDPAHRVAFAFRCPLYMPGEAPLDAPYNHWAHWRGEAPQLPDHTQHVQCMSDYYCRSWAQPGQYSNRRARCPSLIYAHIRDAAPRCCANIWISYIEPVMMDVHWLQSVEVPRVVVLLLLCLLQLLSCCCYCSCLFCICFCSAAAAAAAAAATAVAAAAAAAAAAVVAPLLALPLFSVVVAAVLVQAHWVVTCLDDSSGVKRLPDRQCSFVTAVRRTVGCARVSVGHGQRPIKHAQWIVSDRRHSSSFSSNIKQS